MACYSDVWTMIGKREIVGHGHNGMPIYIDRLDYPYPAIRFREDDAFALKLKEKEKGDWKKLSVEEKKALYRYSFCQTLVETEAPTGEWKAVWGFTAFTVGCCFLICWFFEWITHMAPPSSTTEEAREAQLQRMIDEHAEPIYGVSSKWDYERNKWKDEK